MGTRTDLSDVQEVVILWDLMSEKSKGPTNICKVLPDGDKSPTLVSNIIRLYTSEEDSEEWGKINSQHVKDLVKMYKEGDYNYHRDHSSHARMDFDTVLKILRVTSFRFEINNVDDLRKAAVDREFLRSLSALYGPSETSIRRILNAVMLPAGAKGVVDSHISLVGEVLRSGAKELSTLASIFEATHSATFYSERDILSVLTMVDFLKNFPLQFKALKVERNIYNSHSVGKATYDFLGGRVSLEDCVNLAEVLEEGDTSKLISTSFYPLVYQFLNRGNTTLVYSKEDELEIPGIVRRCLTWVKVFFGLFDKQVENTELVVALLKKYKDLIEYVCSDMNTGVLESISKSLEDNPNKPDELLKYINCAPSWGSAYLEDVVSFFVDNYYIKEEEDLERQELAEEPKASTVEVVKEADKEDTSRVPSSFFPESEFRDRAWELCGDAVRKAFKIAAGESVEKLFEV